MAPEVLSSQVVPASDVWSAGVMAHQLLTGRLPFDDHRNPFAPSISAVWRSVLTDKVDYNMPWWEGLSDEAKDFVHTLLDRCGIAVGCSSNRVGWLRTLLVGCHGCLAGVGLSSNAPFLQGGVLGCCLASDLVLAPVLAVNVQILSSVLLVSRFLSASAHAECFYLRVLTCPGLPACLPAASSQGPCQAPQRQGGAEAPLAAGQQQRAQRGQADRRERGGAHPALRAE